MNVFTDYRQLKPIADEQDVRLALKPPLAFSFAGDPDANADNPSVSGPQRPSLYIFSFLRAINPSGRAVGVLR